MIEIYNNQMIEITYEGVDYSIGLMPKDINNTRVTVSVEGGCTRIYSTLIEGTITTEKIQHILSEEVGSDPLQQVLVYVQERYSDESLYPERIVKILKDVIKERRYGTQRNKR